MCQVTISEVAVTREFLVRMAESTIQNIHSDINKWRRREREAAEMRHAAQGELAKWEKQLEKLQ